MDTKITSFPRKNEIKESYESYRLVFAPILANVEAKLKSTIKLASMPTYKSRVKSFNSYYRKILRLKAEEAQTRGKFVALTDMMGIRVICAFLEDLKEVEKQIKENFKVVEVEYKGAGQNFREFGYESVHVLISLPEDCIPQKLPLPLPENIVCEIQVRTILQDAWAEVEHELIYKSEFSPFDMPLRRKLASMNASLSLADTIFQEIRDYQKKLQGEVAARRETFYEKADELTHGIVPEMKVPEVNTEIARVSPYVMGTIDDMILEAIHSHNSGNLSRAIEIYSLIIQSEPVPNDQVLSVIHKHRGMAYFAQSDYEKALDDFVNSVKFDPKGFRSYYYMGIVYSVMDQHEKAVEVLTQSLDINEFQSHAHYRRAVSYYKLGNYEDALNDLVAAEQLGLEDKDCKALHEKIVEKFGMGM